MENSFKTIGAVGGTAAACEGRLNSAVGMRGIARKAGICIIVAMKLRTDRR